MYQKAQKKGGLLIARVVQESFREEVTSEMGPAG